MGTLAIGPVAAGAASGESEEVAILWEIDGEAYCAYTPPEGLENAFQFDDNSRWFSSATNAGPLGQGDPMTLTWSFIPDGPQGAGFTCGVPGEVAGAPSDFVAFMDGLHGAGPGGADLTMRPWFPIFSSAFANWGALNGINYVYEPTDDGASAGQGGAPGVVGVRGDLRIGGHLIDGQAGPNVLACNYFPDNGDMIFDTGNTSFFGPAPPEHRGFRNVIEHEHGHGLAFRHVCPLNETKLMEPFVSFMFLGAQEDDVLAANRGYGDRDEFPGSNDTSGTATYLGAIAPGNMVMRTRLSIDGTSDQDFYSFTGPAGANATISVKPTGTTYLQGPQTAACDNTGTSMFNALIENNLGVELRGLSGTNVLASANAQAAGVEEKITDQALSEGAGTYFVRVSGGQNRAQIYHLTVSVGAAAPEGTIKVRKKTVPASVPGSFSFVGDLTGSIGHEGELARELPSGTYGATEVASPGWELTSISCNDGNSSGDPATGTATFVLDADESITCTFTNTDSIPPEDPSAVTSTSHSISLPSRNPILSFSWNPGTDAGSGLDGYAYVFAPSSTPACDRTKDLAETATTVSSPALADGAWWFHICTVDKAGNWTSTVSVGPFIVDTTVPLDPTDLVSTSHAVNAPSTDTTIDMTWTPGSDALSGVDGYAYIFAPSSTPSCDQGKDLEEDATSVSSVALADGSWWFHICTADRAGNWTSTASAGPFIINSSDPCSNDLFLENQTLVGVQSHQARVSATLGPGLTINGSSISVRAPLVVISSEVEIAGTFAAANEPLCP